MAEYLEELPPSAMLVDKLHEAMRLAKGQVEEALLSKHARCLNPSPL